MRFSAALDRSVLLLHGGGRRRCSISAGAKAETGGGTKLSRELLDPRINTKGIFKIVNGQAAPNEFRVKGRGVHVRKPMMTVVVVVATAEGVRLEGLLARRGVLE
jgi:hypothetical protein